MIKILFINKYSKKFINHKISKQTKEWLFSCRIMNITDDLNHENENTGSMLEITRKIVI
jgi:hypothetical protein